MHSESIEQVIEIDIDEFISTPEIVTEVAAIEISEEESAQEEIPKEEDEPEEYEEAEFSIDVHPLARTSSKKDEEKDKE